MRPPVTGVASQIDFRLRVGVTGHRELSDVPKLEQAVVSVLDQVASKVRTRHTPLIYRVVSPLAEGADRLVARTVLKRDESADLVAPLPFSKDRYLKDFETHDSKTEFNHFIQDLPKSHIWVSASQGLSDEECYRLVGHDVVDHSDVLIALWDGLPARGAGGTASIICYARGSARTRESFVRRMTTPRHQRVNHADLGARRLPVYVIRTDIPGKIEENFEDRDWHDVRAAYLELDHFNRFRPPRRAAQQNMARSRENLYKPLDKLIENGAGLAEVEHAEAITRSLEEWVLSAFSRADTGAKRFRNYVVAVGVGTATLAAAAVAVAAAHAVLAPHTEILTWLEVTFMAAIVIGRIYVARWHAHRRWVALRAVAEKLREMPVMAVADLDCCLVGSGGGPDEIENARPPIVQLEWYRRAVDEVWKRRPPIELAGSDLAWLRSLIVDTWIGDQIEYHERRSKQHRHWHNLLRGGVFVVFAGTVVCALLHLLHVAGEAAVFFTITLPALGAALSYIEAHREHVRHAERYRWTRDKLSELERRGSEARSLGQLQSVAHDTWRLMNTENADWAEVMSIHDIELSA